MACAVLTPEQEFTKKHLGNLKHLFDGGTIKDIDGKTRTIGDSITKTYGSTTEDFGERMFQEIVWKSTYKPADESFANFTEGDIRRISNEIEKEAGRLNNPKLNVLERLGFVKRGVMGKFAVTRWMNKHINLVTNYERTKFSMYLSSNTQIANHLRTELILRDPSLRSKMPGMKASEDLKKWERNLIYEIQNLKLLKGEVREKKDKEISELRDKIGSVLATKGGEVLSEMVEWLEAIPQTADKLDPIDGTIKYGTRLRTKKGLDKNGRQIAGSRFSKNIEKAGVDARTLLNNMGGVLINGLEQHRKALKLSYNELSTVRLKRYFDGIDDHIASIKEGIENGNYFPHYITEGLSSIEKVMDKIDMADSISAKDKFLGDLDTAFSIVRQSIGSTPSSVRDRSRFQYDNWIKNPLTVLRKYSMDAIAFNRTNYLKATYLKGMRNLPKEGDSARGLNDYLNDVFTLAGRGYKDRPNWVNKTVRALTGYEFFSKIGFGVATAARNTMSGLYYIQAVGNRAFYSYLRDWNKEGVEHKEVVKILDKIEDEQGFRFEDLSNPLFTEGLLPTEGLRVHNVDIIFDPQTQQPSLQYKNEKGWQTFDSILTKATGAGAILQKVTENFLRKHMFRFSFKQKYNELKDGGSTKSQATNAAKVHALDMVNKYAFEYSASQKAPIIGGTGKNLGAFGQVAFQFMHFPMSFLQLQSEILRNSKDAVIARQWNNPDLVIPIKFAGLYMFTQLMSGIGNVDFNRLMENDTVDRIKDLKDALAGKKDIKGRGYIGPAVGDLFFLASLKEWIEFPDNVVSDMIVGYNNAYKLTDEQKGMRLLSTFNVEMAKIPRNWKALQNGTIWSVLMHEFGLYPKAWTRKAREKFPLKYLPWKPMKKKIDKTKSQILSEKRKQREVELTKLYRSMGI
jgi:hypothetical protein